jgi:transposase-like protein
MSEPKTLRDAIVYFADAGNCLNYLVARRWPNGVICPTCGRTDARFLANQRKWQCKSVHHHRQFSIKVGTIFEDSPIGLDKWLTAVWILVGCKNGISSWELHRALGVTQKTAWFMNHRIRLALQNGTFERMAGEVEADETFIGGKARNMHKDKRAEKINHSFNRGKVAVMGLLERHGEVRLKVMQNVRKSGLQAQVREHVEPGSEVFTGRPVVLRRAGRRLHSSGDRPRRSLRSGQRSHQRPRKLLVALEARHPWYLRECRSFPFVPLP